MTKKKRTYNPNLIKARRSYSFSQIAEIYGISIFAVRSWKKKGLQVLDESEKPLYVYGEEIKRFIKEQSKNRKHPLALGEFYCTKCQKPRQSLSNKITIELTNNKLGKTYRQVFIKGVCNDCRQSFRLFSSDKNLEKLKNKWRPFMEQQAGLNGNENNPTNTNIQEV